MRGGKTLSFTSASLQSLYVKAVYNRSSSRVPKPTRHQVEEIAAELGDPRLCLTFIESQFAAMPESFCDTHFGTPYPPANVCFGGECWRRYEEYLESGQRVPVIGKN